MTKDDGTIAKVFMANNGFDDGIDAVVLPIQGVAVRYKSKDKYFKGNFTEILRCF